MKQRVYQGRRIARKYCMPPRSVFHLMWRMIEGKFFLQTTRMKQAYVNALVNARKKAGGMAQLHSLCIMDNHVHMIGALTQDHHPMSHWLQAAHTSVAKLINKTRNRQGPVAIGRPKNTLTEDDHHMLKLMFYLDYNPVRAGLVAEPGDYRWATYNHYAHGEEVACDRVIVHPRCYKRLGNTPKKRQQKYRRLARDYALENGLPTRQQAEESPGYGNEVWSLAAAAMVSKVHLGTRAKIPSRRIIFGIQRALKRKLEDLSSLDFKKPPPVPT